MKADLFKKIYEHIKEQCSPWHLQATISTSNKALMLCNFQVLYHKIVKNVVTHISRVSKKRVTFLVVPKVK